VSARIWFVVFALGAGSAACSREDAARRDAAAATAPAVTIRVASAAQRTIERTVDLVGTLRAEQEATVAAEVDGKVQEVSVDIGDRVKVGQSLARLDKQMLSAALRQADARAKNARADAERARTLHAEGIVSPQEFDRLRMAREVAEADRELLATRFAHGTIEAPISGAVTARHVDVGDYAHVGGPLFTIASDRVLRLRGEVAERFVADIAVGQEVRGEVDAFPGLTVHGRLSRINAAIDPTSRTLVVEAEIDNADGKLRPGFFVRASVVAQRGVRTVTVPSLAVQSFAGVAHLFVVRDGTVARRTIEVGDRFEDDVEITSGVEAGETVAVTGLTRLQDGTKIEVDRAETTAESTHAGTAS
jgi:membrane fusion protein, multidrug efflux system